MDPQELLYPRTRFEVLRALHLSSRAVPLREIAYRADVVVSNVHRAIAFLLKKRVISKTKVDQRVYYQISNPAVSNLISNIINALEPFEIKARAASLKGRSVDLFDKIEERSMMIDHAKRTFKR